MNMIEGCSISETEKADDRDLLSDLPLSIIHIILALIPLRDAVRTSVLSTEWSANWVELHSSIYSCEKLTYLRLFNYQLDPPPLTFKGFLFLRCLCLDTFTLLPDEIYSLVALCPLLESFELIDQEVEPELRISAPNLKYMYLDGYHENISIVAPLMTEISVDLRDYHEIWGTPQERKSLLCNYANCFAGFTNLQKLTGANYVAMYMSVGIKFSHQSLVYHHLKLIDLDVNLEDVKQIKLVAHLVIGAPNLQELKIVNHEHNWKDLESDSDAPRLSFKNLGCASNFKSEKLSNLSLYDVRGRNLEVELFKFLLERSPKLETLRVKLLFDNEERRNKLRAKLQGCNWASPIVKLCNLTWATTYTSRRNSVHEVVDEVQF